MEVLLSLRYTIISLQKRKNSKFTQLLLKLITSLVTRELKLKKPNDHLNQACACLLASISRIITHCNSKTILQFITTMLLMVGIHLNNSTILSCAQGTTISIIIILNLKGILRREDPPN